MASLSTILSSSLKIYQKKTGLSTFFTNTLKNYNRNTFRSGFVNLFQFKRKPSTKNNGIVYDVFWIKVYSFLRMEIYHFIKLIKIETLQTNNFPERRTLFIMFPWKSGFSCFVNKNATWFANLVFPVTRSTEYSFENRIRPVIVSFITGIVTMFKIHFIL